MPDDLLSSDPAVMPAPNAIAPGEVPAEEPALENQPSTGAEEAAPVSSESTDTEVHGHEGGEVEPPPPPEAPAAAPEPAGEPNNKRWYVVKVQSGREESIKEAIERRVKIENLEEFFGQIVIPVERVTEMRKARDGSTKRVIREHKLYPGYLMCEVEYNDRILYLFRETPGVGDFVGGTVNRPPPPMPTHEVDKMLRTKPGAPDEKVVPGKAPFSMGDRVRVRDGTFAGMEGDVKEVMDTVGKVKVELAIFGRPVPVELEYWQVEEA
jgi:transcription termination/antitermination protein NusG